MSFLKKLLFTIIVSINIGIGLSFALGYVSVSSVKKVADYSQQLPLTRSVTDGGVNLVGKAVKGLSFNFPKSRFEKDMDALILKDLDGAAGKYAIAVEDLTEDGERFTYNGEEPMPAASLYKLFVMAAAMEEIDKGSLTMDTKITGSVKSLEERAGKDFGYQDYKGDQVSYSVSDALGRVARISDNYAALTLGDKLGWDRVREQAKKMGASGTSIKDPITTNSADIALFFRVIYKASLLSDEESKKEYGISSTGSKKIIELLTTAQINNRIPAKLPKEKDFKIAHKTGELPRVRNDAGIVYLKDRPYIIVMMSKELKDENEDGIETLAAISKDIYDYFAAKPGK